MSRFMSSEEDGSILEEIESMEVCRWKINEICCNDKSDCLADYPFPNEICFIESKNRCEYFEKENGIIGKD